MSEHLPDILDITLARLRNGEPLETILTDYPAQRDELTPLLLAARELNPLRTGPPAVDVEAGLVAFLDEVRARRQDVKPKQPLLHWLTGRLALLRELWRQPRVRLPVGLLVALIGLFAFMGAAFALASGSVPGDWLYPIKLVGEEVRVALTLNPTDRAAYRLARVRERADEIQRLVETGRKVDELTLTRLNLTLEASLQAAAVADSPAIPRLLTAIETVAAEQAALVAALGETAPVASVRKHLDAVYQSLEQTRLFAQAGKSDVFAFSLNARFGALAIGRPWSALPGVNQSTGITASEEDGSSPAAESLSSPAPR